MKNEDKLSKSQKLAKKSNINSGKVSISFEIFILSLIISFIKDLFIKFIIAFIKLI